MNIRPSAAIRQNYNEIRPQQFARITTRLRKCAEKQQSLYSLPRTAREI